MKHKEKCFTLHTYSWNKEKFDVEKTSPAWLPKFVWILRVVTMERQAGNLEDIFIRETEIIVSQLFCRSSHFNINLMTGNSQTQLHD